MNKPKIIDFASALQEGRWVADDILERHEAGAKFSDHMILVRTAWSARYVEAALAERRIAYVLIGGSSMFAAAHVKDMLSLLRLSVNHYDELAWMRYLTLFPKIGSRKAAKAISKINGVATLGEALVELERQFPQYPQIAAAVRDVSCQREDPQAALSRAAAYLVPILSVKYDRWNLRQKDFVLLGKLAADHPTVDALLDACTLDPISSSIIEKGQTDVVRISTVHSAKGGEADKIYMVQAQAGMYPHSRSIGNEEAESEELRVAYVATSRPKRELVITRCQAGEGSYYAPKLTLPTRQGNGYFFADVPDELVDFEYHGRYGNDSGFSELRDF